MKAILFIAFAVCLVVVYSHSNQDEAVECPDENYENATLLPNPYDCSKYYLCDNGTPIPMECPEGLHFNAKLSICDWPRNAKCKPIPKP